MSMSSTRASHFRQTKLNRLQGFLGNSHRP
jgi:hypothetical protein